jgi:hypothetical protein
VYSIPTLSQKLGCEIRKRLPTNRAVTDEDFVAAAGQVLRECPWVYDASNSTDIVLRERVEKEWFGICPASSWEAIVPKTKGEGNCP